MNERKYFLLLFALSPLIDTFNGFFILSNFHFPIGILYRICCVAFLVIMILAKGLYKDLFTWLSISLLFFGTVSIAIQTIFLGNNFNLLFADISLLLKFFIWILIPYYIYQRRNQFTKNDFNKLFLVMSTLFVLCLLIPYIFGVGMQTYAGSNTGFKGYFYANNDTTIAFMLMATFLGWYVFQVKTISLLQRCYGVLLFSGALLGLILLGTKTGIFYGLFLLIILFFKYLFFQKRKSILRKGLVSFIIFLGLGGVIFSGKLAFIMIAIDGTYQRLVYFYHLYNGNLVQFISSSRSLFFNIAFEKFDQSHSFWLMLFGFGFEYRYQHWGIGDLVEMDLFDILFSLGFIGLLSTTLLLMYYLVLAVKRHNIYSVFFLVLLIYGFFAGHVMLSALSSTLFGLACGTLFLERKFE